MTEEEERILWDAYHLAHKKRIRAEALARAWLCEEQRIRHRIWAGDHKPDGA